MISITDYLQKKDDIYCTKGVSSDQIINAENELGLKFADDYIEYLKKYGYVIFDGHEITGITSIPRMDVVAVTKLKRQVFSDIRTDLYVVENLYIDGCLILQAADGSIYESLPGNELIKIADSLVEYFMKD